MSDRKRGWQEANNTTVSLAGTSMSSPILGHVVFDLTFLNEVSRRHETIKDIHAQVIDSCIAVIISRPLIRANHLVQKIPLYFDETPRSKPDLSQPVVPVTTLATTRARCRGTQTCGTCAPFVAQGYSDTLCSLSVLRTDHPHVPQERRRPHVEPFGFVPAARWLGGSQWHALTYLGSNWGLRDTRHPEIKWADWACAVVAKGGAITFDMCPNWDPQKGPIGALAEHQMNQIKVVQAAIQNLSP